MIKIEMPSDRPGIIRAFAKALNEISEEVGGPFYQEQGDEPEPLRPKPPKAASLFGGDTPLGTAGVAEDDGTAPQLVPASPSLANVASVDAKGVTFDPSFCGRAKEPFYLTGRRAGQWKKLRNVDDASYDAWYSEQLQKIQPEEPEELVDTSAAFSETTPPAVPVPTNMGTFMKWISEKQAAQLLTQDDVNAAYAKAGLQLADVFSGAPGDIEMNIATLYAILSQKAGA